ncbi:dual specificity protein phosphatase 1B [Ischnura elegans]|uniref:dual specificity protein phosphatase 1B n=1 Tax=Ischnura elegans TaxID=197161 RepID=UPI001ED8B2C7|nr:dual specificity protein phosphatase 1B [Ischnura elegans]
MSFLREIASKRKDLRHCQTLITNTLGESFLEDTESGSVTKVSKSNSSPGYVIDYKPDLQLAEIIPGLYLGSQDPTGNKELLQASGITHVLSLGVKPLDVPEIFFDSASDASGMSSVVDPQTNISFVFVPFLDLPEASLSQILPECIHVIDSALSESGRIFVHCNAGVSRSPSVVLAYILRRSHHRKPWAFVSYNGNSDKPLCLFEAVELVRARRPCIKPNAGFFDQLRQYECGLMKENSQE